VSNSTERVPQDSLFAPRSLHTTTTVQYHSGTPTALTTTYLRCSTTLLASALEEAADTCIMTLAGGRVSRLLVAVAIDVFYGTQQPYTSKSLMHGSTRLVQCASYT
jgi:hypothetical protein